MVARVVMLLPNEANARDYPGAFLIIHRSHSVLLLKTRDGGDVVSEKVYHDIRKFRYKPRKVHRVVLKPAR